MFYPTTESLRLDVHSKLPSHHKVSKSKKKKLSADDRVEHELKKAAAFAARAVKKQNRNTRIFNADDSAPASKKAKMSSFDKELTSTSRKSLKKFRAG